eukprot:gene3965-2828_t
MATLDRPLPHPSETARLPLIKSVRAFTRPQQSKADAVMVPSSLAEKCGRQTTDQFLNPLKHYATRKEVARKTFTPRTALFLREGRRPQLTPSSNESNSQLIVQRQTRFAVNAEGYEEEQVLLEVKEPSGSARGQQKEEVWLGKQLLAPSNEDELDTGASALPYWNLQFMSPSGAVMERVKINPVCDAHPVHLPSLSSRTGRTFATPAHQFNEEFDTYIKIMNAVEQEAKTYNYSILHVLYYDVNQRAYALLTERSLRDHVGSVYRVIAENSSLRRQRNEARAAKVKEITEAANFAHATSKSPESAVMYFDLQGAMERLGRRLQQIENAPPIEDIHRNAPTVPRKPEVKRSAHKDLFVALSKESENQPRFISTLEIKQSLEELMDFLDGERASLIAKETEERRKLMNEYDGLVQYLHGCAEAQPVFEHIAKRKAEVARKVDEAEEASKKRQRLLISQVRAYTMHPSEYSTPRSMFGNEEEEEHTARGATSLESVELSSGLPRAYQSPSSLRTSSHRSLGAQESAATLDSIVTMPFAGPQKSPRDEISTRGPSVELGSRPDILRTAPPSTTSLPKDVALTSLSIALGNVWDIVSNPSDVDAAVRLDIAECLGVRVACIEVLPRLHDEVCDTVHLLVEHDGKRTDEALQDLISGFNFPNVLNLYEIFDNGRLIHEDRATPMGSVDREEKTSHCTASSLCRADIETVKTSTDDSFITAAQRTPDDSIDATLAALQQQAVEQVHTAPQRISPQLLNDREEEEAITSAAAKVAHQLVVEVMESFRIEAAAETTTGTAVMPPSPPDDDECQQTEVMSSEAPARTEEDPRDRTLETLKQQETKKASATLQQSSSSTPDEREERAIRAAAAETARSVVEEVMSHIVELTDEDSPAASMEVRHPTDRTLTALQEKAVEEARSAPLQQTPPITDEREERAIRAAAAETARSVVEEVMSHIVELMDEDSPAASMEVGHPTDRTLTSLQEKAVEEARSAPLQQTPPITDEREERAIRAAAAEVAAAIVQELMGLMVELTDRPSTPEPLEQTQNGRTGVLSPVLHLSEARDNDECTTLADDRESEAIAAAAAETARSVVEAVMSHIVELTDEGAPSGMDTTGDSKDTTLVSLQRQVAQETHNTAQQASPPPFDTAEEEDRAAAAIIAATELINEVMEEVETVFEAALDSSEERAAEYTSAAQRGESPTDRTLTSLQEKAVDGSQCLQPITDERESAIRAAAAETARSVVEDDEAVEEARSAISRPGTDERKSVPSLTDEDSPAASMEMGHPTDRTLTSLQEKAVEEARSAPLQQTPPITDEREERAIRAAAAETAASIVEEIMGMAVALHDSVASEREVTESIHRNRLDNEVESGATVPHKEDSGSREVADPIDVRAKEIHAELEPLLANVEPTDEDIRSTAFYSEFQKLRQADVAPDSVPFISYDEHLQQMANDDLRAPVLVMPTANSGRRLKGSGELPFLEDAGVVDAERLAAIGEKTNMVVRRYHKLLPGDGWSAIFSTRFDLFKQLFMTDFKEVTGCLCCIRNIIFSSRGCLVDMDYLHLRNQSGAYINCVIDSGKFYRVQALYDDRETLAAPADEVKAKLEGQLNTATELNNLLERALENMSALAEAQNDVETIAFMDFCSGCSSSLQLSEKCNGLGALVGLHDPVLCPLHFKLSGDDWATLLRSCPRYLRDQMVGEMSTLLNVAPKCIRNVRLFADKEGISVTMDLLHERGTTEKMYELLQPYSFPLVKTFYQIRYELAKASVDKTLQPLPLLSFEYAKDGTEAEEGVFEGETSASEESTSSSEAKQSRVPHPPPVWRVWSAVVMPIYRVWARRRMAVVDRTLEWEMLLSHVANTATHVGMCEVKNYKYDDDRYFNMLYIPVAPMRDCGRFCFSFIYMSVELKEKNRRNVAEIHRFIFIPHATTTVHLLSMSVSETIRNKIIYSLVWGCPSLEKSIQLGLMEIHNRSTHKRSKMKARRNVVDIPDVSEMDPWTDDRCRDFVALNTIQRLRAYHLPQDDPMPTVEPVNTVRATNLLLLPRATPDCRPCMGESLPVPLSANGKGGRRAEWGSSDEDSDADSELEEEAHKEARRAVSPDPQTLGCALDRARAVFFGPNSFTSSTSPWQMLGTPHISVTPSSVYATPVRRSGVAQDPKSPEGPVLPPAAADPGATPLRGGPWHADSTPARGGDTPSPRGSGLLPSREGNRSVHHSCEICEALVAYYQSLLTRGVVLERFNHKDLAFAWWVVGRNMDVKALDHPGSARREALLITLKNFYYSQLSSKRRRVGMGAGMAAVTAESSTEQSAPPNTHIPPSAAEEVGGKHAPVCKRARHAAKPGAVPPESIVTNLENAVGESGSDKLQRHHSDHGTVRQLKQHGEAHDGHVSEALAASVSGEEANDGAAVGASAVKVPNRHLPDARADTAAETWRGGRTTRARTRAAAAAEAAAAAAASHEALSVLQVPEESIGDPPIGESSATPPEPPEAPALPPSGKRIQDNIRKRAREDNVPRDAEVPVAGKPTAARVVPVPSPPPAILAKKKTPLPAKSGGVGSAPPVPGAVKGAKAAVALVPTEVTKVSRPDPAEKTLKDTEAVTVPIEPQPLRPSVYQRWVTQRINRRLTGQWEGILAGRPAHDSAPSGTQREEVVDSSYRYLLASPVHLQDVPQHSLSTAPPLRSDPNTERHGGVDPAVMGSLYRHNQQALDAYILECLECKPQLLHTLQGEGEQSATPPVEPNDKEVKLHANANVLLLPSDVLSSACGESQTGKRDDPGHDTSKDLTERGFHSLDYAQQCLLVWEAAQLLDGYAARQIEGTAPPQEGVAVVPFVDYWKDFRNYLLQFNIRLLTRLLYESSLSLFPFFSPTRVIFATLKFPFSDVVGNALTLVETAPKRLGGVAFAHGCNCFCSMGGGIAVEVKRRFNELFQVDQGRMGDFTKMGTMTKAKFQWGVGYNLYTQYSYDDPKKMVIWDSLSEYSPRMCLQNLYSDMQKENLSVLIMPKICCGLARGHLSEQEAWKRIKGWILELCPDDIFTIVVNYGSTTPSWENDSVLQKLSYQIQQVALAGRKINLEATKMKRIIPSTAGRSPINTREYPSPITLVEMYCSVLSFGCLTLCGGKHRCLILLRDVFHAVQYISCEIEGNRLFFAKSICERFDFSFQLIRIYRSFMGSFFFLKMNLSSPLALLCVLLENKKENNLPVVLYHSLSTSPVSAGSRSTPVMIGLLDSLYESFFAPTNYNVLFVGVESCGKTTFFEQVKYLYNIEIQQEVAKHVDVKALEASKKVAAGGSEEFDSSRLAVVSASNGTGLLVPATREALAARRIQPTVGLNYTQVQHRPTATRHRVEPSPPLVGSLPPPVKPANSASVATLSLQPCTLTLWDVGGQRSLRTLWPNYYKQCHGVVFIVDATLHLQATPPVPAPTRDRLDACSLYTEQHNILKQLLHSPDLEGVPFLVLGNKCDVPGHLSVGELQIALAMDDIASDPAFYRKWARSTETSGPSVVSKPDTSIRPSRRPVEGFGDKTVKIMLVSALTGESVGSAMDWMQLFRRVKEQNGYGDVTTMSNTSIDGISLFNCCLFMIKTKKKRIIGICDPPLLLILLGQRTAHIHMNEDRLAKTTCKMRKGVPLMPIILWLVFVVVHVVFSLERIEGIRKC